MQSVTVDFNRVAESLDLENRIRHTPPSARSRGLFFHQIDALLARRGLVATVEWQQSFGRGRSMHSLYPTTDLARALAVAAALLNPEPTEGLREIFRAAAAYSANTWFGRVFRRVLVPEPLSALRWLERSRDFVCNYGSWRVEERAPGHAVLHMFDEYLWIDSLHRGGCEGLLASCGVVGTVEAEMEDMFRGRLHVRWELH